MRRRDFITLLSGAAAAWPIAARGQQGERVRRVGVLSIGTEGDPPAQARLRALREGLAKLGWTENRNLRLDVRLGGGNVNRIASYATELIGLDPDVLVAATGTAISALQQHTHTIPIVITGAGDVTESGLIKNLAHPEANLTGVTNAFASVGGKWLELLKEAAPRMRRVALLQSEASGGGAPPVYIPSIREAARVSAVPVITTNYRSAVDIVRAIDAFAAEPDGGVIVLPPPPSAANREAIVQLTTQYRLPAIHGFREFAEGGGLMSYGSDITDVWRRSAAFVDRLLRGAKVADLPVEFPTKFELVINLKAARAIGLSVPPTLLARADEVIE